MSIEQTLEKIKPFYHLLLIIVLCFIFFALGRLSAIEGNNKPIRISTSNGTSTGVVLGAYSGTIEAGFQSGGEVIGSKSGKKYYFPWCGTVKRIKPENQIKFASAEEAKAAGYTPGGNCKGLE